MNPKFVSYKLNVPTTNTTALIALPSPFALRPLPDHARLSFAEVQARVRHNHLSAGFSGELVYVTGELQVIAIELDAVSPTSASEKTQADPLARPQTGSPTFHLLTELPQAFSTNTGAVFEYPTALAIDQNLWAVSDGAGQLYILRVDKAAGWKATVEATRELVAEAGGELVPFRLHSVDVAAGGKVLALLSTVVKVPQAPLPKIPGPGGLAEAPRSKLPSPTMFDYVSVDLGSADGAGPSPLQVRWKLRSYDLPASVNFLPESSTYIIAAPSSPFDTLAPSAPSQAAPGSNPSLSPSSDPTSTSSPSGPKPPPFSWMQDGESVTVAFPLPSDTPTSSIRVTFSRHFLTLFVGPVASLLSSSAPSSSTHPLPRVSHKKLWDDIDPYSSVWTFDREAEGRDSTYGIVSLHLEKANQGTKWSDVFAGTHGEEVSPEEKELENVAETVDPSELAKISESMEQWTQGVPGGVGASNEGLGHGVPTSLTGEEMDVEVDGDTGRRCVVTWIVDVEGQQPKILRPHEAFPISLLSNPLPVAASPKVASVVVKNDVDGLLFRPPASPSSGWTHTATFPALSFVLATKRDSSFVYHLDDTAVFAFDSPSNPSLAPPGHGPGSAGNLFVYFRPPGIKDPIGKQMVLRIGGPGSGALLGVAGVPVAREKPAVVVLCENEVVVYRIL